jgi:ABC-2 type transport system permease protein
MYHAVATMATAKRIMLQLRHDPRTLAMIFIVPCVLLALMRWLFGKSLTVFDSIAPALLGIFPFIIMFIITSITTLRERTAGTLERLMTTPLAKADFIGGYMIAFGVIASLQALLASFLLLYGLDATIAGPTWFLVSMAILDALLGTALGLFVSAFATTEFQAVQFMPAFVLPQLLICGLFVPLGNMPNALEFIAHLLPLTYAVDALNTVARHAVLPIGAWQDVLVVTAFIVAALILGSLTLRRRTN